MGRYKAHHGLAAGGSADLLTWLRTKGNITAQEARERLGIVNLDAAVLGLKAAGWLVYSVTQGPVDGPRVRTYFMRDGHA